MGVFHRLEVAHFGRDCDCITITLGNPTGHGIEGGRLPTGQG
jgi:hypothetical protein